MPAERPARHQRATGACRESADACMFARVELQRATRQLDRFLEPVVPRHMVTGGAIGVSVDGIDGKNTGHGGGEVVRTRPSRNAIAALRDRASRLFGLTSSAAAIEAPSVVPLPIVEGTARP